MPDPSCPATKPRRVARIEPYDVDVIPQLLTQSASDAVIDLVEATGRTDTSPAPWWFDDESEAEPDPPDNVTYLGRRFGGWTRTRSPDDTTTTSRKEQR